MLRHSIRFDLHLTGETSHEFAASTLTALVGLIVMLVRLSAAAEDAKPATTEPATTPSKQAEIRVKELAGLIDSGNVAEFKKYVAENCRSHLSDGPDGATFGFPSGDARLDSRPRVSLGPGGEGGRGVGTVQEQVERPDG